MSNLIPFTFESSAVRVVEIGGEAWFVGADVCAALDLGNSRQALTRLDDDEKGVHIADTPGGRQNLTVINESGLYSLILTSRKPEAKRFKKWVTAEVLPSIRKTGGYGSGQIDLHDPDQLIPLLSHYAIENKALKQQAAEAAPPPEPLRWRTACPAPSTRRARGPSSPTSSLSGASAS